MLLCTRHAQPPVSSTPPRPADYSLAAHPPGINSSFCMAGFDRYTSIERAKRGLPNDLQRTSCLTEAERVSGIVAAPPVPAYRRMGCSSYNGAKPTVFAFASGSTQVCV